MKSDRNPLALIQVECVSYEMCSLARKKKIASVLQVYRYVTKLSPIETYEEFTGKETEERKIFLLVARKQHTFPINDKHLYYQQSWWWWYLKHLFNIPRMFIVVNIILSFELIVYCTLSMVYSRIDLLARSLPMNLDSQAHWIPDWPEATWLNLANIAISLGLLLVFGVVGVVGSNELVCNVSECLIGRWMSRINLNCRWRSKGRRRRSRSDVAVQI